MPKVKAYQRTQVQILQAKFEKPTESGGMEMVTVDDMRSSITFQLDNGKTIAVNATVSYKKHLAESYRTNGEYRPKTAPTNTVCNLTQTDFSEAFGQFLDNLLLLISMVVDFESCNPSGFPSFPSAKGVRIVTDTDWGVGNAELLSKGDARFKPIHCFPCHGQGPRCFDLKEAPFNAYVYLQKYIATYGMSGLDFNSQLSALEQARDNYDTYGHEPWFLALTLPEDIGKLEKLIDKLAEERIKSARDVARLEKEKQGKASSESQDLRAQRLTKKSQLQDDNYGDPEELSGFFDF